MRIKPFIAAIVLAAIAPAAGQQLGQRERTFTFTVTETEARLVDAGLGELQTKATFQLVSKLHQQWSDQLKAYGDADALMAEKAIRDKLAAEAAKPAEK